ncbi:hypothetical protein QF042_003826 [Pedobacter sp. W3I1]|uniref:DUF4249 domain-containing protein n=1 Tax=Pedobacter sp. W3I1 TaxID=3042291 RepID=UPI0027895462|nr:DUF4249 domain-containing protein [Pedobacter sp. W3I1]MDQ0640261.1 hypothetical protein [Pedobacter sp. W3I1]
MKKLFYLTCLIILFASCEKEVDLDLDNKSGTLVIEGNITDQPGPYYVRLTRSVPFTSTNQYPPVTHAFITITDTQGQTDTLQHIGEGRYQTSNLHSVPGHTYNLLVKTADISYTAQSTMPTAVDLESLQQDPVKMGGDTTYNILPIFNDPASLGNRYFFVLTANGHTKKILQTISDNVNNGLVNQRSITTSREEDDKIKVGDRVNVEMQCVDERMYNYYTALIQITADRGPGGSVTPANPPSNINSGALGYFSAHTTRSSNIEIR